MTDTTSTLFGTGVVGGAAPSAPGGAIRCGRRVRAQRDAVLRRAATRLARRRRRGAAGFNWFLSGVLASPMLPGVALALLPRVLGPVLAWFAAAAPL